ncbi:cytochrome P450 CYP12A2 isoform X2 [Monomorium pharaonis]|uniref:cytochrome P450 CYP12A2 isoform X2 n=1 Tax=Monomorium pharaonis TaxID=307658 RepID=UPI00174757D1|nr:cytochrome P450 CYP12A2 isoform X2 [Monomorium pharaonis]
MNVLTLMRMLRDKYGNIVKLDGFAQRPCIFLFCPELCKSMYQLQGKWPIRISMESLLYYRKSRKDIYGGQYGLVISQGELWQKFRTKVNPHMLQPQIIKPHVVQICETVNDFVEYMRVLRDPKTLELSNDFMNELYKWSLETMFSIALDYRLGCLKPNLVMNSEPQIIINCVKEMFELLYRLENPSPWKATNMRNLKKLFQTSDIINEISNKYIKHAKTKFLETSDNTSLKDRSILMRLLCIDEQIAYVMVLDTLTSIDTTSNAAAALLYYVANNVKKQEKLREEVMSVLPSKTTPITHDMLERIPYTKACIKESLRMFPIASGVQRTIQRDVLIGGYIIPKEIQCRRRSYNMECQIFQDILQFNFLWSGSLQNHSGTRKTAYASEDYRAVIYTYILLKKIFLLFMMILVNII